LTMRWVPQSRIPGGNMSSPHQCVNWNKLEGWTASRRLDPHTLMKPGYLNHPTLGPSYPEGHGDAIGELILVKPPWLVAHPDPVS